jgi:hypothetical protein
MWLLIGILTISSPLLLFFLRNKIEITKEELEAETLEHIKKIEMEKEVKLNEKKLLCSASFAC